MKTKYVVHDEAAYIFPEHVNHSEFADMMGMDKSDIKGAGFVYLDDSGSPVCYGKSISLGIDGREDKDTEAVKRLLGVGDHAYA